MKKFDHKEHAYSCPSGSGLLVIWLLAVSMPVAASGTLDAAMTHKAITDNAVTLAVERDLNIDEGVMPNFVDVSTSHGIVTLSGSVADLLAKKRAVRIAESFRGVLGVIDNIVVTPVSRPDEEIREDIVTALRNDPATASYQVAVSVKDGVLTLTGSVGSWRERQIAARIAEEVSGIREVHDGLAINYTARRTDVEIAADISESLNWDVLVNGYFIKAVVQEGRVMLGGTVGSVIERSRAIADAWVNGVMDVDASSLKVEPWARDEMRQRRKYRVKSDAETKRAIELAFHSDPRVSPFTLDITVENGVVVLSGPVSNLKAKTAAEHDAKNTVGVSWVDNLVGVRPKSLPSDADAEKNLKAAVRWNPLFVGSQVEVAVIHHVAYLAGWVDSAFQRAEAQDVAERINGVVEVRNHLRIWREPGFPYRFPHWRDYAWEKRWPPPPKSDAQIKKDIEKAFFWSPFVDRDDITVNVHDGVAILRGTVSGYLAYGEADRDARKSGAIGVINRLNVKKGAWF